MSPLPLVSHVSPDSIIAWRAGGAVTLRQFLSEVRQLAALFPAGGHLLNMCSDRYRFSVGLAAAIVAGKVSLLPSTHTTETVRQIKVFAPDVFCLTDSDLCYGGSAPTALPGAWAPAKRIHLPFRKSKPASASRWYLLQARPAPRSRIPKPGAHWSAACRPRRRAWAYCMTRATP